MAESKKSTNTRAWRLGVSERRVLLVLGDLAMAGIALAVALYFWATGIEVENVRQAIQFLQLRPPTWFYFLPLFWLLLLIETYNPHIASNWRQTLTGLVTAALVGMGIYFIFYFASAPGSLPRRGVASFALTAWVLTALWRLLYIRIFTSPQFTRRAILVGAGISGQALLKVINNIRPVPYQILGVLDDDPQKMGSKIEGQKVLGNSGLLLPLVEQHGISDILVAISGRMRDDTFRALLDAQEQGVEIVRMPVAYEELLDRVPVNYLEADWLLRSFVDEARVNRFYLMAKRLFDIIGGLIGVIILILLTPFIALATLIDSGRPVIFFQTRAGRGGKTYRIIKFRTMRLDAEETGKPQLALEDDQRSTRVGRFLRKTHMDEWPQFINVLRGDMSLVGPRPERPELMRHFEKLIPFYRARLLEKPGITGWAQVNFGYAATLEDMSIKLEYDLYYIKRRGPILDFIILLRTIGTIFGFRGR
ncbi:MAG: exopolysaccharide biosynthesis polyprenyl glycosylphosphotransferase [Chloroflexi bacterium]|nr:exopolysaccharide biosynthesis polyprenyl glycosylphosphotransferase [Chloroflexota bacterium]